MSEQFGSKITYPFMMIPNKLWELGLTPIEQSVLNRIIFRAGREGDCFESRESMAKACGISVRSVSNALDALEQCKVISVICRKLEGKTNLISVNEPAQWISKLQMVQKQEMRCAPDADLGMQEVQTRYARGAHRTRSPELNSIEQDSFLNTVPTASAVEVLEAEKSVDKPHKASKEQTGGSLIFEAFADAYHDRYGFEPMRGKEANRWAKKIYEEVGAEEGQHLVRHYVSMNKQWFLQKGHSLEWCFRDLTEVKRSFVTGRTMTTTQIKQLEQRQTAKETSDEVQQSNGELAAAWARIDTTRTIKI